MNEDINESELLAWVYQKMLDHGHAADTFQMQRLKDLSDSWSFEVNRAIEKTYDCGFRDGILMMRDADLMTDIGHGAEHAVKKIITIIIRANGYFNVVCDAKMADALLWDVMLGQIVSMTHYKIDEPRYPMLTRKDIEKRDAK